MAFTEQNKVMGSLFTDKQRKPLEIASTAEAASAALSYESGKFYELESAEVIDIILDPFHPEFTNWNDIGKIKARLINSEVNKDVQSLQWINPSTNGIKKFPLLHEIVIVGEFASDKSVDNHTARNQYYFMPPLNIFNSVNENTMPNVSIDTKESNVDKKDYEKNQIENYNERTSGATTEQSFEYDVAVGTNEKNPNGDYLGNTFLQNYDIVPLLPFEGDTILEGRFGNSIRFGSTIKLNESSPEIPGGGHMPNWWSEEGINGDPIMIIRNGQSPLSSKTEIDEPAVEDLDSDGAIIMLTSGQTIDFCPACDNMVTWQKTQPHTLYNSQGKEGLKTNLMRDYTFSGNQIIMSSDRIVMNARKNEFMVYANGDIGFSTNGDFHINCRALRINAQENHNMTAAPNEKADAAKGEPAVLGRQLSNLIQGIVNKVLALRYPGAPGVVDDISAEDLRQYVSDEIDKICSKQAFQKSEPGKEVNV